MYNKGDFHLHTNASDGKLPPKELVALAKVEKLDIIAITDHDNTFGVEEAIKEGTEIGVKVIPGIELSTRYNGESIHILGYFSSDSYKSSSFQQYLQEIQDFRIKRAEKIVYNLKKFFHIEVSLDNLLLLNTGIIARPHIAKAIIKAGYPFTYDYIFDNFIGSTSPAYVPNKEISISEGIEVLKSVNALTGLAHPVLIKNSPIEKILQFNFDCIEGIYPLNKPEDELLFRKLAKKYKKILTAGSDYHGIEESDTKHGYLGRCLLQGLDLKMFLEKIGSL